MDLDKFTRAYIQAALWSSNDNSTPQGGEPLSSNYDVTDIAPDTLEKMSYDCASFQLLHRAMLERSGQSPEQSGHDFWLTRNGHGAGFWDRGLGPVGDELTTAAHSFKEFDLYVGDDGKVHGM